MPQIVRINAIYDDGSVLQVFPVPGDGGTTTPTTKPTPPSNLLAVASGAGVILTWADNATTETGYRIERKTGSDDWSNLIDLPAATKSYADMTVSASTSYQYRVMALGSVNSAYSNWASITTPATPVTPPVNPTTAPAAPTGLTAVSNSAGTTVNLSWTDASSTETGFRIQRQEGVNGWKTLTSVTAGSTTYADTTTKKATAYKYRVYSVNVAGETASSSVSVTTSNPSTTLPKIPWGFACNAADPLPAIKKAMDMIKSDGGGQIRIWTSHWGRLSNSDINIITAAKNRGVQVILCLQQNDGDGKPFGNPDISGWAKRNEDVLPKVDVIEVGNELNLSIYRYSDFGTASNWHTPYVQRFLKPVYNAVKPFGCKVIVCAITDTSRLATYNEQYDALLAAGAGPYADGMAIHYYATSAYVANFPAVVSYLKSSWGNKPIYVTEANVHFRSIPEENWPAQVVTYINMMRSAQVSGFLYYRGFTRSDGHAGAFAMFDKDSGEPTTKYAIVEEALNA